MRGNSKKKKEDVRKFYITFGKFPHQRAKDPAERALGQCLKHYTSRASGSFDAEMDVWVRRRGYAQHRKAYMPLGNIIKQQILYNGGDYTSISSNLHSKIHVYMIKNVWEKITSNVWHSTKECLTSLLM
jgi:hypothetical protein